MEQQSVVIADELTPTQVEELNRYEAIIETGLETFMDVGEALASINELRLYRGTHATFEAYCRERWGLGRSQAYRLMDAAEAVRGLSPIGDILPARESQARELASVKEPAQRQAAWAAAVESAGDRQPTAAQVKKAVELIAKPSVSSSRGELAMVQAPTTSGPATFNRTNENVDWAWWTWNPVTGCLHDCPYCYARDIANRFYPQGFVPTFHADRLTAPQNTPRPKSDDPRSRRVFTCSMADLFGKWVPQEWIDAVFTVAKDNPQWEFLFLTKFPQRLAELAWPANAWVGTTVDRQYRVEIAEKAFRGVKAGVKWLSCEPLLEPLKFSSLEMFDLVVIGGSSRSTQTEEFWPPFDWIFDLVTQARAAGCHVYLKPNAISQETAVPQELPAPSDGMHRSRGRDRQERLTELESRIEAAGMEDFLDVAHALLQIRDQGLWKQDHAQYEHYMQSRWGELFRTNGLAPLVRR